MQRKGFLIILKIIQYAAFIVAIVVSNMVQTSSVSAILTIATVTGLGSLTLELFLNKGQVIDDVTSDEIDRKHLK